MYKLYRGDFMGNDFDILDITNINIDLQNEKELRAKELLNNIDFKKYNKIIKVNDTIIYMDFLSIDKISTKMIFDALK